MANELSAAAHVGWSSQRLAAMGFWHAEFGGPPGHSLHALQLRTESAMQSYYVAVITPVIHWCNFTG